MDFLVEALANVFPVDVGIRGSPYRAYRRAWKRRSSGEGEGTELLLNELKEASVPGAYGPLDSPPLVSLIRAWEEGTPPGEAKHRYGRKFDRFSDH